MAKTYSLPLLVVSALSLGACGGPKYIGNLPLSWRTNARTPAATTAVDRAFDAVPFELAVVKDSRPDRTAVGVYEEDGFVVRTRDDVTQFFARRLRDMLEAAGARLDGSPLARVSVELLQFDVVENNRFNGTVKMRVAVARAGGSPWTKTYVGTSKPWGRTHKPDNFNEALTRAFHEAARQLVQDEAFASALLGKPVDASSASPQPGSTSPTPPPAAAPGETTL